jgi:spermidine/putrescine transport system permease protein
MTAQPGLRAAPGPDAGASSPSEAARAATRAGSRRRGSGMGRRPKVAVVVTVVFFALLYLPIVAVVVFSFNTKKSLTVFDGWSLQWYSAFFHDSELTHSLGTSIEVAAVAMVGSVIIGTGLAFGLVRARSRLGGAANLIMLIPLVTPEIVTGVASLMLFKGVYLEPGLATLMIAETTFSISYVTVILRARVAELNPEVEEAAMDLGATRAQAVRLVTLPLLWPAILSAAILIFTLVFDDFVLAFFTSGVSPQPLSVRIYSAIRFGVQPSINAVGTLMLVGSLVLIALALLLPRLLGRRTSALDLFN